MHLEIHADGPPSWRADALVLLVVDKDGRAEAPGIDSGFDWMQTVPCSGDVSGEFLNTTVQYAPPEANIPRIVAVGAGKQAELTLDRMRAAVAAGFRRARDLRCPRIGLLFENLTSLGVDAQAQEPALLVQEAVVSAALSLYRYTRLKTSTDDLPPQSEEIVLLSSVGNAEELSAAGLMAMAEAEGVSLARDLVNGPGNVITPSALAHTARELGMEHHFSVTVYDEEQAEQLGMGAFAAVFQGSSEPARFIVLDWSLEGREEDPPLVLAGKGVTFDTGGVSIKPSANMEKMKGDMAGAAAVLGVFAALGRMRREGDLFAECLRSIGRVVGLLPCTDNMCDGMSVRPGDVVTSHAGKTVEVVNTDAEGRLLLCDALSFAGDYEPEMVVDIATLTGACVVALGRRAGAVFSNSGTLTEELQSLSAAKGEPLWPMPLFPFYKEDLRSHCADLRNTPASREGGSIHAALFLQEFAPEHTAWAHLDIAGPGWSDKAMPGLLTSDVEGGTGFGVRTLLALACRRRHIMV